MKTLIRVCAAMVLTVLTLISGCGSETFTPKPQADAVAVLIPAGGSQVTGQVAFALTAKGMRVMANIDGLPPGPHGFHIHQFGDCRAPDALSAGDHFNPGKTEHGAPADGARHAGDLGNIIADDAGRAKLDAVASGLTLEGPASIIGRSVIVHADPDDLKTQPAGAAGVRLACGVIGIVR